MSSINKYYALLGILVVASIGTFIHFKSKHSQILSETEGKERGLNTFKQIGNGIHSHNAIKKYIQELGGISGASGLNSTVILELTSKYNLKVPDDYQTSGMVKRKTHMEEQHKFSLKNEYLENVIKLLLDLEKISNTKVENFSFVRNPKDKDRWNANNISVVQISAKE